MMFDNFMAKLSMFIKLLFTAYATIITIFMTSPASIYVFTGTPVSMMPSFIPGTGPETTF